MTQTQQQTLLPAMMQYERVNAGSGVAFKQFRAREIVHAYLLTGARGLGKRTFAKVLASALFCTSENRPCGECNACKRVLSGNEPDVLTLFADDGKSIGVDRVREVVKTVSQHAFGTGYRVVMIEPVERMTPQAQNCLLKSLEEPVANVVFLLMTHELTATLGTIASRCARIKLAPWSDELMGETLQGLGYSTEQIKAILVRSGGNIGAALDLLDESKQDEQVVAFVNEAMQATKDADTVRLSTALKENREAAERYLAALETAIHQALLVNTGRLAPELSGLPPLWQKAAQQVKVGELNALLSAVFEARRRRAGQVNWQATIDHLMMSLLEEQTKWQQSLV